MAEKIVIEIVADGAGVEPGIKAVEKLGTAAEKDIATFNKLNQTVGNDTSAAVKKVVISAEQARKAFADTSKGGKDGFAQIREEAKKATGEINKVAAAEKSLREQIRAKRNEAAAFADQNSAAALKAQRELAGLIDKQQDLNQRAAAFAPDAKFQAFTQLSQNLFGVFQAGTGIMQLFGVESKEAAELVQKFQGAINVTQGLNSLLALKDTLGNVRAVLGLTAAAQETLAVATTQTTGAIVAEGAAATGAAAATRGFTAALLSNPFTAVAVVLASIATALYFIAQNGNDAAEAVADFAANSEEADKAFANVLRNSFDADNNRLRNLERQLDIMEAMGASEYEILKQKVAINDQEIMIESNIRNNLKAKQEQLKQDEILYDLTAERAVLEFKINELISRRVSTPEEIQLKFNLEQLKADLQKSLEGLPAELQKIQTELSSSIQPMLFTPSEEMLKDELNRQVDFYSQVGEAGQAFFDIKNALNEDETQHRIENLEKQKEAGIITEKEFQDQVKSIRRKQAVDEKQQAMFQTLIQTAVNINKALGTGLIVPNIPAAAFAAALGAFQLAAISSRPIPTFKKGQLPAMPGAWAGEDNQLAYVNPKEAIFTAEQTRDYYPAISLMYKRKIAPDLINSFAKGEAKNTTVRHKVTAKINPYDMRYAMDGVGIKIKNIEQLSSSIAKKIGNGSSKVREERLWA